MLRYLYLLSLLLCIELTFSYDYIENSDHSIGKHGKQGHNRRIGKRNREKKHLARQEYDIDKSPVEFDVASFIQDEETVGDARGCRNDKRRPTRNYEYYGFLDSKMNNKKTQNNEDYIIEENEPPEISLSALLAENVPQQNGLSIQEQVKTKRDKVKKKNKQQPRTPEEVQPHRAEKKNAFKHLRFPFFSHETPATIKPKKSKKRKPFSYTTKSDDTTEINLKEYGSKESTTPFKMKRSYEERLCPACKKKYLANNISKKERRKYNSKKIAQNTRQFYENLPDEQVKDVDVRSEDENKRKKREDEYKVRQLKELEEVQKKIDNVKLPVDASTVPKFLS